MKNKEEWECRKKTKKQIIIGRIIAGFVGLLIFVVLENTLGPRRGSEWGVFLCPAIAIFCHMFNE